MTNGTAATRNGKKQSDKEVDDYLSGLTKDQQRELLKKIVAESSLADVKSQRDQFEAHIAERAAEIDEGDKADIAEMRKIYEDAIAVKEREARREVLLPLVLATVATVAMWRGIEIGNGWLIASSLVLFLWAGGTNVGLRFVYGLLKLSLGLMALLFVALVIGAATLLILAISGNFKP
jgi:hypothetical protein